MVGALNGENCKSMLLSSTEILDTKSQQISQSVIKSLSLLWPNNIKYDKLWLILTDQARNMLSCFKSMKELGLFPNLHHITCLAHALHRVCELIRSENHEIDKLVSSFKLFLVKSPKRIKAFRTQTGISVPPKPVITRWGTWLSTCFFYAENFDKIKEFIVNLKGKSKCIIKAKKYASCNSIQEKLINLMQYKFLPSAIKRLENSNLKLEEQLNIIEEIKSKLSGSALQKLNSLLSKNPDFDKFTSRENSFEHKLKTSYAPIVTVDVERSFSRYKRILEIRPNLLMENTEKLNIIEFNNYLSNH